MLLENTEARFRAEVQASCAVVLGETVLFLGGAIQDTQIRQITPLGIMRIGTLPFGLNHGTCLVIENHIFFGFGHYTEKNCSSR